MMVDIAGTRVLRVLAVVAGVVLAFGEPATGAGQPSAKAPVVAILSRGPASPEERIVTAFRQGLRDFGWVEGQNLRVEVRYADWKPERIKPLAAELIQLGPDVLWGVAGSSRPLGLVHRGSRMGHLLRRLVAQYS